MKQASTLNDIHSDKISSEDLHTHLLYNEQYQYTTKDGYTMEINKIPHCHDCDKHEILRQAFPDDLLDDDNTEEHKDLHTLNLVDNLVKIDRNILADIATSQIEPNSKGKKKDFEKLLKKLQDTNTPYLTGSACIKHIPLNELMVNLFNIEPNKRNVNNAEADATNTIYAEANRKKLVLTYRSDGVHTTELEQLRSEATAPFEKFPSRILYTNEYTKLTEQYRNQGCGEFCNIISIFFLLLKEYSDFALPVEDDSQRLHYPFVPSLSKIEKKKRSR